MFTVYKLLTLAPNGESKSLASYFVLGYSIWVLRLLIMYTYTESIESCSKQVSCLHNNVWFVVYTVYSGSPQEENLKMIISHGLQCVVKGKLDEAEVIFTQAILLPDFQRIELKAFVYICLAVVANKRQSKG